MAASGITSLPALPEDGGAAFPPGHFKDPKRLYCKNGGFFLRIHPDGRVDGVREKSDPHAPPAGDQAFKHVSLRNHERKDVTYKRRRASMFINMLGHSSTMRLAANSVGWVRGRTLPQLFMLLRIKRKMDKEAERKMAPAFPHHFLLAANLLPLGTQSASSMLCEECRQNYIRVKLS